MDKKQELIPTLLSGEVDNLLKEVLQRELQGWKEEGLIIRCLGSLMNLNARRDAVNGRWNKLFGVTLDAQGPLHINAQKELLADFEDGDYIEVVGYPTINVFHGKVTVQFEVIDARLAESIEDQAQRRDNHSNIAKLNSLKPSRNPFPLRTGATLDMIYSSSSSAQVDADFKKGLGDQVGRCNINACPVRITSAEEIAQAIQKSRADILVIIRGGGGEAEFQVFNHDLVLQALAAKSSYRVMGIGHSANTTMVDLIADYSATVPSAAGAHIRDQFLHLAGLTDELEDALEESQRRLDCLEDDYKELQLKSKADIDRLHDSFQTKSRANGQRKNVLSWVLVLLLSAIVFGLVLTNPTLMNRLQQWSYQLLS